MMQRLGVLEEIIHQLGNPELSEIISLNRTLMQFKENLVLQGKKNNKLFIKVLNLM